MKTIFAAGVLLAVPFLASAAPPPSGVPPRTMVDAGTGCGLGTLLFDGNTGVGAHIFAMTTNGSFGNATFGMSSGTLGCDASQPIRYKGERVYISANMTKLAADMARGGGETLAGLSEIMGISAQDKPAFYALARKNFERIFPSESATSDQVTANLIAALKADPSLAKYVG